MSYILHRLTHLIKANRHLHRAVRCLLAPYRAHLDARQRRIYDAWQRQHIEQPPPLSSLTEQPRISIIVPTYNTPIPFLREMVQSVVAQSYPHWELILVDDASTNETTRQAIRDLAEDTPQLKPFFLDKNRHIAGATNYGIAQATGEYIALLDHDDTLHPDALLWIAAAIDRTGAQFVYTDETKMDENGRPYQPFFKPDWNEDFLRAVNYITHFAVISRQLLTEVGGEDGAYNGTQDWELFLRLTRALQPEQIAHVPQILYYWRVHQASTAKDLDAKPYVIDAQRRALEADSAARQVQTQVERDPQYGAQWQMSYILGQAYSTDTAPFDETTTVGQLLKATTAEMICLTQHNALPSSTLQHLAADAARPMIGAVVPRITDERQVIANLSSILQPSVVDLLQQLSRRSFTKHIYLTARYNLGTIDAPTVVVARTKLAALAPDTPLTSAQITAALCGKGYNTLYNPHVTPEEDV